MILTATYWSTGRGYRLFPYKVVSIQVYSVADVLIVSRAQGTKNIYAKCFLVQMQALLEVIEIFVEFHCLSLYRSDLYRKDQLPSTTLNPVP